jgi:hypothetical protein
MRATHGVRRDHQVTVRARLERGTNIRSHGHEHDFTMGAHRGSLWDHQVTVRARFERGTNARSHGHEHDFTMGAHRGPLRNHQVTVWTRLDRGGRRRHGNCAPRTKSGRRLDRAAAPWTSRRRHGRPSMSQDCLCAGLSRTAALTPRLAIRAVANRRSSGFDKSGRAVGRELPDRLDLDLDEGARRDPFRATDWIFPPPNATFRPVVTQT